MSRNISINIRRGRDAKKETTRKAKRREEADENGGERGT